MTGTSGWRCLEARRRAARSARSPSARTRPAPGCPPSCRTIARPRRRLRSGRTDSRRVIVLDARRRSPRTAPDRDRRAAAPRPARGCPARRPCRSRPSTGRRRSRSSVLAGSSAAFTLRHGRVDRLEPRRERRQIVERGCRPAAASGAAPRRRRSVRFWPSANGTIRMSENRIAASSSGKALERLERDLGRGVAVIDEVEKAALGSARKLAIFGKVAPGLAHHPDRRRIAPLAASGRRAMACPSSVVRAFTRGVEATLLFSLIYIYREKIDVVVGGRDAGFRRALPDLPTSADATWQAESGESACDRCPRFTGWGRNRRPWMNRRTSGARLRTKPAVEPIPSRRARSAAPVSPQGYAVPLVLASSSPIRRAMLEAAGVAA